MKTLKFLVGFIGGSILTSMVVEASALFGPMFIGILFGVLLYDSDEEGEDE